MPCIKSMVASSPGSPIFSTLACVEKIGEPGDEAKSMAHVSCF